MAELALRIWVETHHKIENNLEVAVSAVVTNGEKFLEEDSAGEVVLAGNAAALVHFEDYGDDGIAEGPKIKDDSIIQYFRAAIFIEKVTEEDEVSGETRALVEVKNGKKVIVLVGKRAIAATLRELEYRSYESSSSRARAQAIYIRKAIGLVLEQLGEGAKEAIGELMVEFLKQDRRPVTQPEYNI